MGRKSDPEAHASIDDPIDDEWIRSTGKVTDLSQLVLDERIKEAKSLALKHLAGKHDQKAHGHGKGEWPNLDELPDQATPAQKKKFAQQVASLYKNDSDFRQMCDTLSLYTQGSFDNVITVAKVVTAKNQEEALDQWARDLADRTGEKSADSSRKFITRNAVFATLGDVFGIMDVGRPPKELEKLSLDEQVRGLSLDEAKTGVLGILQHMTPMNRTLWRGDTMRKDVAVALLVGDKQQVHKLRPYGAMAAKARDDIKTLKKDIAESTDDKGKKYFQGRLKQVEEELLNVSSSDRDEREYYDGLFEGSTFSAPLMSITTSEDVASGFANRRIKGTSQHRLDYDKSTPVTLEFSGSNKGLKVSVFSPYRQSEVLTSGKFKVVRYEAFGYGNKIDLDDWRKKWKALEPGDYNERRSLYRQIVSIKIHVERVGDV